MKRNLLIYSAFLAACLYSCQTQEETVVPQKDSHKIFVNTSLPNMEVNVKSGEINIGKDIIYAYPFQVDPEFNGTAIAPDSINGSSYSYYLPKAKEDLIFTNAIEDDNSFQILTETEGNYLEFYLQDTLSGCPSDLVIGKLPQSEMQGNDLYNISLERVVSELTVQLKMIKKGGSPIEDLSLYLTNATLEASHFYKGFVVDKNMMSQYTGERSATWSGLTVNSDSVYQICENSYIFPSAYGNAPKLTLFLETPDGQTQELNKTMSHAIEANKHYKLTLVVRQRSTEFGFIFEDFIEEEIPVGGFEETTGK